MEREDNTTDSTWVDRVRRTLCKKRREKEDRVCVSGSFFSFSSTSPPPLPSSKGCQAVPKCIIPSSPSLRATSTAPVYLCSCWLCCVCPPAKQTKSKSGFLLLDRLYRNIQCPLSHKMTVPVRRRSPRLMEIYKKSRFGYINSPPTSDRCSCV